MFDLLAERGLLVTKRMQRGQMTTLSKHRFKKYPNIVRDLLHLTGLFLAGCSSALPASASFGKSNVKRLGAFQIVAISGHRLNGLVTAVALRMGMFYGIFMVYQFLTSATI
jgi:hypothetical protein